MRAVFAPREAESAAVGVFIGSGSRHETPATAGISHFIEHMLFKGTPTRSHADISRAVEGRGGTCNAGTGEEHTCYYMHLPSEYLADACDILSDMYYNASIPADEFDREKMVVIEEIKMYDDDPSSVAAENLQRAVFPKSQLGSPVAGSPESLAPMRPADLKRYIKTHYLPSNTVVSVSGCFDESEALAAVERFFGRRRTRTGKVSADRGDAGRPVAGVKVERVINQTQIALGYRAFGFEDPRRHAAAVMNAVLGRGMSSRLFMGVREKLGLCYDIYSELRQYRGAGLFSVSAGTSPEKAAKTLSAIEKELRRMREKNVPAAELKRVKDYLSGMFRLGLENVRSRMFYFANSLLAFGRIETPEEQIDGVMSVTAADVKSVAEAVFRPLNRSLSLVVPKKSEKKGK